MNRFSYAQTTFIEVRNQTKDNTQRIQDIEDKMLDLKDNYRLLYDGAKNQNDQLGNLISYSGYILAILGIILAAYINSQYKKIKELKDIVETTKEYIDKDNKKLYENITRDETLKLLKRLKEVPEDITNIYHLLFSRDLLEEDYISLKEQYLKIKNDNSQREAKDIYIMLLMQHFPYQSLKDSELKTEVISKIDLDSLNSMFSRDIKNFFVETLKYLKEFGIGHEQEKTIIKNLFYFYSKSHFQANVELNNYIKESVVKSSLNVLDIHSVAKEQAPTDSTYTNWLNSIFSS